MDMSYLLFTNNTLIFCKADGDQLTYLSWGVNVVGVDLYFKSE